MDSILKYADELHRARSEVRLALMDIILKHVDELHRAFSHVRIAWMGIILTHWGKHHNKWSWHNFLDGIYYVTFRRTS